MIAKPSIRCCCAIVVSLVAVGCGSVGSGNTTQSRSIEVQVTALLPEVEVVVDPQPIDASSGPEVRVFEYRDRHQPTPYGFGVAMVNAGGRILWVHLLPGDYRPRDAVWADFDGDGSSDLLFYQGEEDVRETHIILNRRRTDHFSLTNFYPALSIDYAYAVIAQNPQGESPDLLVPLEVEASSDIEGDCLYSVDLAGLEASLSEEYRRLSGSFYQLKYAGSHSPDLFLFQRVRILSLQDGWLTDVTRDHSQHLRWRINMLESLRESMDRPCQERIDDVISYFGEMKE